MNHSKLHGEASYLRRPKLFKASSRQPRRPPRQPQPPPAAQPPGRAATSTTNRDLRRLLDLRGAGNLRDKPRPADISTSDPAVQPSNEAASHVTSACMQAALAQNKLLPKTETEHSPIKPNRRSRSFPPENIFFVEFYSAWK